MPRGLKYSVQYFPPHKLNKPSNGRSEWTMSTVGETNVLPRRIHFYFTHIIYLQHHDMLCTSSTVPTRSLTATNPLFDHHHSFVTALHWRVICINSKLAIKQKKRNKVALVDHIHTAAQSKMHRQSNWQKYQGNATPEEQQKPPRKYSFFYRLRILRRIINWPYYKFDMYV